MVRLALLIEYNGKNFSGSQFQTKVRTVQNELESALSVLAKRPVSTIFSGRTDSGVHARGQVIHCDLDEAVDLWQLNHSLNGILNADLSVINSQIVPSDFHARFKAISREYVYRVLNRPHRSVFLKETHYFVPLALNIAAMKSAASLLLGKHDFSAFKSSNSDRVSTICNVSRAELLNLGEGVLEFWIVADHFVYNMVRIIVGTLIEIGLDKRKPESIYHALTGGNRELAGPTAPAWGLCLNSVQYPNHYDLFTSSKLALAVHSLET